MKAYCEPECVNACMTFDVISRKGWEHGEGRKRWNCVDGNGRIKSDAIGVATCADVKVTCAGVPSTHTYDGSSCVGIGPGSAADE